MQLVEILDNILEQLAPKQQSTPYSPQVRQTLSACLSVCRQVRHLAAERLFQAVHVKTSIERRQLDNLLKIVETPSQEWMSIRPFIRNFAFIVDAPVNAVGSSTVVHSLMPDYFVPLFDALAISNGNFGSQITRFKFQVDIPIFSQVFEDAILRFMKLPTLQALEIYGPFFFRDFLRGTHIREVSILGCGIDLNLGSDDLYTEELGPEAAPIEDEWPNYPRLRTFKTDLVWPRGFPDGALDIILSDLTRLNVEINISHAFIKAEALIMKAFSSLTTLIIVYNFDGYEAELPTAWSIDFGEFRSLETLEFNWSNSVSSTHQNTIARGCRPLAGLHSLIDKIGTPMRSLTTIRWNFRFLARSLPPDVLSQWLQSDNRWLKLDQSLASDLFPCLHFVSLDFTPIAVFNHEGLESGREDNTRLTTDFDLVEAIVSENRQRVFPNLTTSLGDNLKFKAVGEVTFTQNTAANYPFGS